MPWQPEFWEKTLSGMLADLMNWLPALGAVLLLLIIGWVVARLAQALLTGVLRRLRFDRLGERSGAATVLRSLGMDSSASLLVARLIFWLVLLVFLLAAAETLNIRGVTTALESLIAYLPRLLAAGLILLLGAMASRLVGKAMDTLAGQSGIRGGVAFGLAGRYLILIFVVVLALGQLGLDTTLLIVAATVLLASAALALTLAFGLGSRDLARNIMAGLYVREEFAIGQKLEVGDFLGRLKSIGPSKSVLETEPGLVSVPNSVLLEMAVTIISEERKVE